VNKDEQPKPLKTEGNVILFQSVKELLYNIVKHAQATSAKISIQRACNDLRIVVEDNGIGFNIDLIDHKHNKTKGFGLFSICERLEYYGGSLTIESNESQGTKITLLMPMVSGQGQEWCETIKKYMDPNQLSQLAKM
jgi:signal transduction histidine kinase